jgi:type II secretory pathway pseudopilin PulG
VRLRAAPAARDSEAGYSIVILIVAIAVMMILMGAAAPTWRYVMQDDREQELFFRGDQIARAIEAYQRKNGNAFPASFEVLVQGKYLRRQYKDPMTKDGKWRIVRPGEMVMPGTGTGPARGPSPRPSASASTPASAFGPAGGTSVGAIAGVASLSGEKSLRLFNGRSKYDQWVFLAGQPRRLGRDLGPRVPVPGAGPNQPGIGPNTMPGAGPSPLR